MPGKTKATAPGRQCHTANKSEPEQITTMIGLVNLETGIPVSVMHTALSGEALRGSDADAQTNQTNRIGSFQNRLSLSESVAAGGSPEKSGGQTADMADAHPFGSTPRCCSSLRNMRFIQVASDESPSLRISSSSWARKSSLRRIWYCGDFFSSCIDMCNYPNYHLSVITRVITSIKKSNAPECANTTEASDHSVNGGNIMASAHDTQTRPKFTWRFLAVDKSTPDMRPITLYTNAPTEEQARQNLPGLILYFAARLPLLIPEPVGVRHV